MVRNFRREAYALIVKASHDRSRNFELILIRLIRRHAAMRKLTAPRDAHEEKLDAAVEQAKSLIARLGGEGVLR